MHYRIVILPHYYYYYYYYYSISDGKLQIHFISMNVMLLCTEGV